MKHISGDPSNKTYTQYCSAFSERMKQIKNVFILLMLVVLCVTVFFFDDSITYQSFEQIVKSLDSSYYDFSFEGENRISYTAKRTQTFDQFHGNLVLADTDQVSLYDRNGKLLFSEDVSFSQPTILTSEKFFLVYDLGGKSYSAYGYSGKIHEETGLSYPIFDMSVSDSGSFCIITRSRESSSCVLLYDKSFHLIGKYENNRYITSCHLSDQGKTLYLATVSSELGQFHATTSVYQTATAHESWKLEETEKLPLKITSLKKGQWLQCYSDGLVFREEDGDVFARYSFQDLRLKSFCDGTDRIALLLTPASEEKTYLYLLDLQGKVLYNKEVGINITALQIYENTVFYLTENSIVRISEKLEQTELPYANAKDVRSFYVTDENSLMVVFDTFTEWLEMPS